MKVNNVNVQRVVEEARGIWADPAKWKCDVVDNNNTPS